MLLALPGVFGYQITPLSKEAKKQTVAATKEDTKPKFVNCLMSDRKKYMGQIFADKKSESFNEADSVALRKVEKIETAQTIKDIQPIANAAHELESKAMGNKTDLIHTLTNKDMAESMEMVEDVKSISEVRAKEMKSMEADALEFHMLSAAAEHKYDVPEVDAAELTKMVEKAGAQIIAVHGRTREQKRLAEYKCNW